MSANFMKSPSRHASLEPSSQPRSHRLHRHKKFHVRPEALGKGYETYNALTQSSSPTPADSPAAHSIPEVEAIAADAAPPNVATTASEWEKVSEKETSLRAARIGLRFWCWGLTLLITLVLLCGYRGWLWRVVDWMHQFPLPTL